MHVFSRAAQLVCLNALIKPSKLGFREGHEALRDSIPTQIKWLPRIKYDQQQAERAGIYEARLGVTQACDVATTVTERICQLRASEIVVQPMVL